MVTISEVKWTMLKYRQLCADVKSDMQHEGMDDDSSAYDIADSILTENAGLKEFIQNELGAEDYKGKLASDI